MTHHLMGTHEGTSFTTSDSSFDGETEDVLEGVVMRVPSGAMPQCLQDK